MSSHIPLIFYASVSKSDPAEYATMVHNHNASVLALLSMLQTL